MSLKLCFFPSNFAETVFASFFPDWTIGAVGCKDGFHLDLLFVYTDLQLSTSICGEYNRGIVGQDLKFCKTMKIILFTGKLKKRLSCRFLPPSSCRSGQNKALSFFARFKLLKYMCTEFTQFGPLSNIIPIFCRTLSILFKF